MSLISELKRRNVIRVGAAYVVTAWLIIQVVETIFPVYGLALLAFGHGNSRLMPHLRTVAFKKVAHDGAEGIHVHKERVVPANSVEFH